MTSEVAPPAQPTITTNGIRVESAGHRCQERFGFRQVGGAFSGMRP